jgi:hypothetical protein
VYRRADRTVNLNQQLRGGLWDLTDNARCRFVSVGVRGNATAVWRRRQAGPLGCTSDWEKNGRGRAAFGG